MVKVKLGGFGYYNIQLQQIPLTLALTVKATFLFRSPLHTINN